MANSHEVLCARLIALTLSGAWRYSVEATNISEPELSKITPLLLGSGAGALVWRRILNTGLETSPAALELKCSYQLHTIHALLYQHKIKQALLLLRSNGIEPILIKGWSSARLYPESGLRPYGDIDFCVRPDEYQRAKCLMDSPEGRECWVDLHKGMGRLDDRSWDELFERSQMVNLDEVNVRVLGVEDHLRISSVHFLDHGAWRPIWLCDIAATIESITRNFDWNACLGNDKRRAKWIISAIKLAHKLVNARIDHCPEIVRTARLPAWLVPTVLKQWERPCIKEHAPPELIMISLRHPFRVPKALFSRWPNPIEATIRMNGSFNELPRILFQVKAYINQTSRFMGRLPRLLRE